MQSGTQRRFSPPGGLVRAPHLLFGLRHLLQVEAECTDIEGRPQHEEEACGCEVAVARERKPVQVWRPDQELCQRVPRTPATDGHTATHRIEPAL